MKLKALTLSMITIAMASAAGAAPPGAVSTPDFTQPGFDSMDAAAKAAESVAMQLSKSYEYGGGVYQKDDKFFYTSPITQNDSLAVDYRIALPKSATLVAIYHTHPDSSDYGDAFSVGDIQTAQKMHLTMYVGVVIKSHVLKFNPSINHVVVNFKTIGPAPFYPSPL